MNSLKTTALVTGANKGIGLETARQLAQLGFTVWLGSRNLERGEAAAQELASDGDVRPLRLDVSDQRSVHAAAEQIASQTSSLDVLVNNAGAAFQDGEGSASVVRADTIRRTMDVNFYGSLAVSQAFLPLVRQAKAGRIVNVSSTLGSLTTVVAPSSPLAQFQAFSYPVSKTMLNALTSWLAVELADTPIKVNSVCPGANATDMNPVYGTQHPSEGAKIVVRAATLSDDGPTGTFLDATGTVPW